MRILLLSFLICLGFPALAVEPHEMLNDPILEERAQILGRDLRCVVCQNESIEDSNADLARDLRVVVRERISEGDTDGEVIDFMVARYGDFVLLRPPFKSSTFVLWLGPLALLILGIVCIVLFYRKRQRDVPVMEPLSAKEQRRLSELLDSKDSQS